MSATTVFILFTVGLPVAEAIVIAGLVVYVRRLVLDQQDLRRWRHDVATPSLMALGERAATIEQRVHLPVQDGLADRLREALRTELPS